MRLMFVPILFFVACSLPYEQATFVEHNNEILEYFEEVVGFEYSSDSLIRRFEKDIFIFVHGIDFSFELLHELKDIIQEVNELTGNGVRLEVVTDPDNANFDIYLTTEEYYVGLFPSWKEAIAENFGYYHVYFDGDKLGSARIFVDTKRASLRYQRHLLREELTQAMGLGRDSDRYEKSVFFEAWSDVTTFLPIDLEVIRLMYHEDMQSGIDRSSAVELARKILN